ncbi:MAG: hypothetical protein ACI8Z5_001472 [Lentimonas sp.]|jgi:hypothetical protein
MSLKSDAIDLRIMIDEVLNSVEIQIWVLPVTIREHAVVVDIIGLIWIRLTRCHSEPRHMSFK